MPNLEQLRAFVTTVDQGSFSAAARKLGKAQSVISTSVINLEIDIGVELFDRSARTPVLTIAGNSLLASARSALDSSNEFIVQAASISEGIETQLCIAVEQGVFVHSLLDVFKELAELYPHVEVDILDPGINDVANLLKEERADIGLMMEQESHPQGFHFRGLGYSKQLPVCHRDHPLAKIPEVSHADLRKYRQLISRSRLKEGASVLREQKSPSIWYSESPYIILELLSSGIGWAVLPQTVVADKIKDEELVPLQYDFQQSDILQGVDVVWTERKALGPAGQWFLSQLLALKADIWSQD